MLRRLQLLLAMGCNAEKSRGPSANGDKVLARIDGEPITNADLVSALAAYSHDPYIQARYTSPEKRRDLLQNLIVFKVMLAEAKRQGLENDPEVRRARMEALAKAYIEKEIKSDPWGNEYVYTVPGPHGLPFGISSYGADGSEGGEGNNADINSWEN